ncbi:hypothetical protein GCM10007275_10670 [Jeotgalicoccus coquinae]|uniref:Plastocyanin n=1 Tax=Jeotgalicoccus coquinae TaxID=709509 RepID=A0A6V7RNB3_9STAP|nr:FixH family protein [Jeotgalicoccus coquinae]MBB6422264.1 plastocyanin [Jeotgalicoccus coquinae]GGE17301.1 hypothetical protein GCM10007275_10670 [Jeotgalicoccus coquinae]CAD2079149.1 hypothetical protein JEOCOQ751_01396 [Jeotgalicoccus coquinae]
MKIKAGLLSVMLLAGLTLAACSEEENHDDMNHDSPSSDEIRSLEVDLQTPESVQSGEAAEFTAHVTSNEEDVTDADQVMFEVLKDDESMEMVEVEHSENGEYVFEYTFEEPGEYSVIAHVDAFQLHTMPEESVTVE